jgi:hypothetical protein
MMNILEIQDALKGLSNDQLVRELRTPSGSAPAFLVATEIDRRQKMRQRFTKQQPQTTVIDDLTMQMNQGIGGMMPQPMPMNQPMGMPKSSPELMPARRMAAGGLAGAISAAIAPVLAKAQADAVGGVTSTFVGDTSPVSGGIGAMKPVSRPSYPVTNFPISRPSTPTTGGGGFPAPITPMPIVPDLGGEKLPLPPGLPAPGTNPIMGKGSNPNMAVDRLPLGSIPDARFAREGGQMKPAKGMFLGGIARLLGRAATPRRQVLGPGTTVGKAGVAPQSGGTNLPMTPINPSQLPVPYTPPSLFQRGLGALRTGGKFLLGASPLGAGLFSYFGGEGLGDSTMVGKIMSDFGLTEEEALLLEQELLKRGKDFYTDKQELKSFADQIIATRPGGPGLKTQQDVAVEQQEQQKQKEKTLIDMLRERDEKNRNIAGLQTGLDLIARGAAGEPLGRALPASVGKIFLPALSKMGEAELKFTLDQEVRKAAALAKQKGTTKDLIDYRQDLAKQLTDPTASLALTAEQKKIISDTIERLDAIIQTRVGIGSSGGASSLDTMEAIRAALGAKTASVKG